MKAKDKENVLNKVESEGFDYCFIHYSKFPEIKDERFHVLVENYTKAARELAKYIGAEL